MMLLLCTCTWNDLIFIVNDLEIIVELNEAMFMQFEMKNIVLISYFLRIEIFQFDHSIFVSQEKYEYDILKKFKMDKNKPILTPVEENLNLTEENTKEFVDSPTLKFW